MRHHQLDILVLEALSVNLLIIVLLLLLLFSTLNSLAGLAVGVVVAGVVVVTTLGGKGLSSGLLGSRVQVLNLSLTEDANMIVSYTRSSTQRL